MCFTFPHRTYADGAPRPCCLMNAPVVSLPRWQQPVSQTLSSLLYGFLSGGKKVKLLRTSSPASIKSTSNLLHTDAGWTDGPVGKF